jgi:hypothetical protein
MITSDVRVPRAHVGERLCVRQLASSHTPAVKQDVTRHATGNVLEQAPPPSHPVHPHRTAATTTTTITFEYRDRDRDHIAVCCLHDQTTWRRSGRRT